jgi:hypothetical protein
MHQNPAERWGKGGIEIQRFVEVVVPLITQNQIDLIHRAQISITHEKTRARD